MLIRISSLFLLIIFLSSGLSGVASSWGQDTHDQPTGTSPGFVVPESIKGFDEEKVKNDPICDSSVRPQIDQVKPDEVKAGDTIVLQGKYFGKKKECLHGVTFGPEQAKKVTYMDAEHIEAVVPEGLRTGVMFINVETGGGTARKGILVKSQD